MHIYVPINSCYNENTHDVALRQLYEPAFILLVGVKLPSKLLEFMYIPCNDHDTLISTWTVIGVT